MLSVERYILSTEGKSIILSLKVYSWKQTNSKSANESITIINEKRTLFYLNINFISPLKKLCSCEPPINFIINYYLICIILILNLTVQFFTELISPKESSLRMMQGFIVVSEKHRDYLRSLNLNKGVSILLSEKRLSGHRISPERCHRTE